ncbi:MAG TPA: HTH domain-containing protein [Archaeoglobaceae archaeon]|nr:HTH domain-containing protein [Archaeoglobaceae archaeon]
MLERGLDLNRIQYDIVRTLIRIYQQKNTAIRADEMAKLINRNPGTVRNQMQILKTMGIVEGSPGPKGGYWPTIKAYELIGMPRQSEYVSVPVYIDGIAVGDADEIIFSSLSHPEVCYAKVRVLGDIDSVTNGQEVVIGPTPVNKLMIYGSIIGKDDTSEILVINIKKMQILEKR